MLFGVVENVSQLFERRFVEKVIFDVGQNLAETVCFARIFGVRDALPQQQSKHVRQPFGFVDFAFRAPDVIAGQAGHHVGEEALARVKNIISVFYYVPDGIFRVIAGKMNPVELPKRAGVAPVHTRHFAWNKYDRPRIRSRFCPPESDCTPSGYGEKHQVDRKPLRP